MATYLQSLKTYWANNSTLTAAIPANRVYLGFVPASRTTFPYASFNVIASVPEWTTGNPYVERTTFTIDVFHTNLATLDTLMATIAGQFDWKSIDSDTMSCIREGLLIIAEDNDAKTEQVYHGILTYDWTRNQSRS